MSELNNLNEFELIQFNCINEVIKHNKKITSSELILLFTQKLERKEDRLKLKELILKLIELSPYKKQIFENDNDQSKSIEVIKMLGIFE